MLSLFHEFPSIGVPESIDHFFFGGVDFAILEVFPDGSGKQDWFLADIADVLPKRPEVQLLDIHPVKHHLAFLTVIEPFQQLHHSALALATFSHQGILFVL